ncbi:growth/differentiation factor 8-like [Anneissia japonica]|uniref:growth/differentiation factor 8-like n=1 Tax=Anneissia japonica TaxID=1529436 RepID=UPI0014258CA9|nr:growth/differentiation factor 8-like [Anneissia japonica]
MYSQATHLVCILLLTASTRACLLSALPTNGTDRARRDGGDNDSMRPREEQIGKALEMATKRTIMEMLSIDESFINELNSIPLEEIPEDKMKEYDNLVLQNEIQSGKTDIVFNISDKGHSPSMLPSKRLWRTDGSTERLYFGSHFAEARGRKRKYRTKKATLTFFIKPVSSVSADSIEINVFEFFNTSLTRGHVKSRTVSLNTNTWQEISIDVTDLVDDWLKFPRLNFGIEIGTTTGEPLNNFLNMYSRRWILRRNNSNDIPQGAEHYPVITVELQKRVRSTRDTKMENGNYNGMCSKNQVGCCRKNYTIDFKKIEIGSLVLRPKSVNMFYCSGACADNNIQMNDMHTLFKHYVHSKYPLVNGPCCVPTRFDDLPVIMRKSETAVEVMILENLIALDCKCS